MEIFTPSRNRILPRKHVLSAWCPAIKLFCFVYRAFPSLVTPGQLANGAPILDLHICKGVWKIPVIFRI